MYGLIDNTLLIFLSSITMPSYDARGTPANATFNNLIDLGAFQPSVLYSMKTTVCIFV